ncbi:MAG: hypothetical protein JNL87_08925 [Burkholderiaceae bacterium]|nr:hypothetical protein [Burkholderiaceae bacterium]
MTSASMTFGRPTRVVLSRPSRGLAFVESSAGVLRALLRGWRSSPAQDARRHAEDLLERARLMEPTQPSYAADLRAAAALAQNADGR